MPKAVQSSGFAPYSDKASGKLRSVSIRDSDNDGYIVSCYYERGMPEDYVYEDMDGALAYLKKQVKKLGTDAEEKDDE